MVESSMALPFLILLLLTCLSLTELCFVSIAGHYAVTQTAHWAAIGDSLPGMTREDSIKEKLAQIGASYGLSIDKTKISICPITNAACTTPDAGNPNDMFFVAYKHSCKIGLLPLMQLGFGAFARNEPYA